MPIYTYKCRDCGDVFDFLMIKKTEQPICKKCGSDKLEKQLSAPGAVMMGSPHAKGSTCCGRTERCDTPPCSSDGSCKRD